MPEAHDITIAPVIRVAEGLVRVLRWADARLRKALPFFWHRIRLELDAPRHHRHETQEYEDPYRWSNSHVLRLCRSFGVVVGRWQGGGLDEESPEYEAHLNQAVQGRTFMTNERFREVSDKIEYQVIP